MTEKSSKRWLTPAKIVRTAPDRGDPAKAAEGKVTHREAAVLLECELEDLNQRMFTLAKQIKEKIYGNRIVMFAPLYLSNYCINGCVYCPYHQKNKTIPRRKLTRRKSAAR